MKRIVVILAILLTVGSLFGQEPRWPNGAVKKYVLAIEDNVDTLRTDVDSLRTIVNPTDSTLNGVRYIDFDLMDGIVDKEGRVRWDDDDKTLEVGLDAGSVLQVGQEVHMRAVNKTGSQINDGDVVYVSGAQGNRPTIVPASDTSQYAILTLGVATQDIAINANGYVTLIGLVRGYDTRPFRAGNVLWLGTTPGSLDTIRARAPNTAVTLGVALNSTEDGIIAVRPVVVQRLAWLSDVKARGTQNANDFLVWNGDSLFWQADSVLVADSIATDAILYTDTYWDDLRITPGAFQFVGSGDPIISDWQPGGTGRTFKVYKFQKNQAGNASIQMPHDWKVGTDLEFHIHWTACDRGTEESGNTVGWKVDYTIADIGEVFPSSTTLDLSATTTGTDDFHEIIEAEAVDGSTYMISHEIVFAVYRSDTGTDDTWVGTTSAQSPALLEIDIHYQRDRPGSEEEYLKY